VWIGRPFNYAASIGGHDGVRHAIKLMQAEIERDMMMLGIRALDELGPHAVKRADGTGVVSGSANPHIVHRVESG
jgi:L-lactate dehydrogenase (cytochrome)